ncbi:MULTISPECIES: DUF262 domain-containing protein [Acinetobacter]|uniref:GmrSD restriction endonucleases N-terminal domain-containing protein n=1 Tax=Acinetobacter junii TaxID=40215 RepID=A0A365PN71_ACIJU|nr:MULTISPECIES: DUF262 domain-containing protein [Acinetobacter]RBA38485.1 hypothetical protein DDF86_05205 [Acinetobacter junii]RBA39732.1 hypothetical protein DDG62_10145 [Acinetobacter junii]RBA50377.1 hypothetical protein DC346_00150 [Acinetobacter junii]WLF72748.1 DUF262 domain-containing protein [Acinetobacter junii]
MDLKGAELRNFYAVSQSINDRSEVNHGMKIPHYQRPYRWDKENVEKLILDWKDHKKKTDYFSGSIVTVASDNKEHDLIDGQQRFTTLFLANFVRFLVLRELVSVSLREQKYFPDFKTLYKELIFVTQYLFKNDGLISKLEDLGEEIYQQRQDQNFEESTRLFNISFFLSSTESSNVKERIELLQDKLKESKLFLTYDRSTFNDSLAKVLSNIIYSLDDINTPKFYINNFDSDFFNESERTYLNAIEEIVRRFESIVEEDGFKVKSINSFVRANSLKDKIGDFLTEVKLCLIQTGNTEDAYTLFEVLNDRALALDDLDLIKNLFYKNFVIKNDMSDAKKDRILQNLDQQWIEKIYQSGISDAEKKLVTYLAIAFISGSTQITHKATKDYRTVLNKYFENTNYSEEDIKRDFNIFEACKIFVKVFGIRFRSQDIIAVQAEYDKNVSVTYKVVHLLMALKQEGVLSGLVNFLLNYIKIEVSNFDPEKVKKVFEELKNITTVDNDIEAQSKIIWKLSIQSKDATLPRQLAVNLISANNLNSTSPREYTLISKAGSATPQDEFNQWIDEWKFGANLKVRILFSRLFKLSLENDVLVNKFFSFGLTEEQVRELELDHMEAQNPSQEFLKYYFQDELRDYYINGIGNIMPLPKTENIKKSNLPLIYSFDFYNQVGLDKHFIMDETQKLLKIHSDENGIPTAQFFMQRKIKLIEWFKQCIEI